VNKEFKVAIYEVVVTGLCFQYTSLRLGVRHTLAQGAEKGKWYTYGRGA
jgi:hypothetical protein